MEWAAVLGYVPVDVLYSASCAVVQGGDIDNEGGRKDL